MRTMVVMQKAAKQGSVKVKLGDSMENFRHEKSPVFRLGFLIIGGADGTRTRDPRRDRPVF